MLKKLTLFSLTGPITLVLMMWKRVGLFLRKSHLLRYWGCLFLRKWIGIKFLSPQVALHLYKSTIQLCIKYYCHIWVGVTISWSRVRNLPILWEPLISITSSPTPTPPPLPCFSNFVHPLLSTAPFYFLDMSSCHIYCVLLINDVMGGGGWGWGGGSNYVVPTM